MATTNVGQHFGIVTSKNQATAIIESKKDENSGQFYITRTDNSNTGGVGNTEGDASQAISLTMNGNVLRGISKDDAIKLARLNIGTYFNYRGSVDNVYNLPTNAKIGDVYNISNKFVLNNKNYDAYTSVVYINSGMYEWQALGGEITLGTKADGYYHSDSNIYYHTPSYDPINSFHININTDSGLCAKNNSISAKLGPGLGINAGCIVPRLGSGLIIYDDTADIEVHVGNELQADNTNGVKLNADYLSGTVKDANNNYYSLGGIYFSDTIKSGQKNDKITIGPSQTELWKNYGLKLRCGTGLAFQEGYEDFRDNSSQILGHDGRYYVNIDNTTIGLNIDSKLRVKHDSTLSESSNGLSVKLGNSLIKGNNGINVLLPIPTPSDLSYLPVSTAAILINVDGYGLCVDMPALKHLVEMIMAAAK